ncbi:MAG: TatD family hydrolase [Rickettsiales bacterium]
MQDSYKIKLIDSHCHLNYPQLYNRLGDVINNAKIEGVELMQTICTKRADIEAILNIINNNDSIFGSIGIHPTCAHEANEFMTCDEILQIANKNKKIIGVGETGLDYYRKINQDEIPYKAQRESFLEHIYAAQNSKLGLIIHTRDAEADTYEILKSEMLKKKFNAVLHCFTGSKDLAKKALDLGLYISFSGICTFKNTFDLQEVVRYVPMERILIETDAPYLAPQAHRGKTNEPAYVKYIAQQIANLKYLNINNVAEITSENFYKVFILANNINIIK